MPQCRDGTSDQYPRITKRIVGWRYQCDVALQLWPTVPADRRDRRDFLGRLQRRLEIVDEALGIARLPENRRCLACVSFLDRRGHTAQRFGEVPQDTTGVAMNDGQGIAGEQGCHGKAEHSPD
jgi:hypothetical protein